MLLEQRERQRPLCPQGRPTPRARHVNAVFLRYYGKGLQPAMAELERGLRPWLETTGKLWAQLQGARRSQRDQPGGFGSSGAWALAGLPGRPGSAHDSVARGARGVPAMPGATPPRLRRP